MPAADLPLLVRAALDAGPIALRFWKRQPRAWDKGGTAGPVTEADLAVNARLETLLRPARPDYGWLSEESADEPARQDARHCFIVDPIDGTTNFMHAMPHFAITVGLERRAPDGSSEIVAGVTYNPVMNEMFWAEKGKGCYLNDARIRVAGRKDLSESLIATGLPFIGKTGHAQAIKDIHAIGQRVAGIRRIEHVAHGVLGRSPPPPADAGSRSTGSTPIPRSARRPR